MTSIPFEDLATIVYVLVDDWYLLHGVKLLQGKRGSKPRFSDSEVITLVLLMDFLPFPGETQYLGFIRANYLELFPELVDAKPIQSSCASITTVGRRATSLLGWFARFAGTG